MAIQLPRVTNQEVQSSLQELERLVTTLGYKSVGQVIQKRASARQLKVLGEGKLKELAGWTGGPGVIGPNVERKPTKAELRRIDAENSETDDEDDEEYEEWDAAAESEDAVESGEDDLSPAVLSDEKLGSAQIVIVDSELSPSQLRNLEKATGVTVLDRTGVIIEIFSRHARTRSAKLQVEIARLAYLAPRLRETGGEDRQVGGGGKGLGESRLELNKRNIRDRIKELKEELSSIGNQDEVRRVRREKEICVALVGYTNAGKSSLMRAMTGSEVLVADKLFATLDTTVRALYPETTPRILMSDTVGFIKKLPHDLVASFKSTLDEALNASLLLFVVDASDPSFRSQLQVTQTVLAEVGAVDVPSLLVLNKRDCLSGQQTEELRIEFPDAVFISTRDKEDLLFLRDKILSYFERDMTDEVLFIPYSAKGVIGEIRGKMRVLGESFTENGVEMRVRTSPQLLVRVQKMLLPKEEP